MTEQEPWADMPPSLGRTRWRLGVLDHDLTNGDLQVPAEQVAGWYVEDVTRLLELLEPTVTMISPHVVDPGNDETPADPRRERRAP